MLLVFIAVTCIAFWLTRRFSGNPSTDAPTLPDFWPLIGHLPQLLTGKIWEFFRDLGIGSVKVGGVGTTIVGPWKLYVISDPEDSMTVLNGCLEKDAVYKFWKPWMGEGLFTGSVHFWRPHRKLLAPAFNQRTVQEFAKIFHSQAGRLVQNLSEQVGKGPFDIHDYFTQLGLETILRTAMGQQDLDRNTLSRYLQAVTRIEAMAVERGFRPWLHNEYIFSWTALKKAQDKVLEVLHELSSELIENRKSIIKNNNNLDRASEPSGIKIFLDLLIELNDREIMSEKQIKDEVDTVMFGGFDTSALTLVYTVVLLGSHPEVQDRMYAELKTVFGGASKEEASEDQDLSKLMYTEAVLKESMRIYPFAPIVARHVDRHLKLKNCTLTPNSRCIISVYEIQRDPALWGADALKFRPERWLEPGSVPACPAAFGAFSWGKRSCIGKTYAMLSMKTYLAYLVWNYRFRADHTQLQFKFEVALKPTAGHLVSIQRRI